MNEEILFGPGYHTLHGFTPVPSGRFTEAEVIKANGDSALGAGYLDWDNSFCELPSYYRVWSKWTQEQKTKEV
jgi:hypothetical protein